MSNTSNPKILYTSLAEIKSFDPCASGWKNILKGQGKTEVDDVFFPILEAVESNSIGDVCWLLGRRKVEIQLCVKFAKLCADAVSMYKDNPYAATYATYASDAASDAATNAAFAATNAAFAATNAAFAATNAATNAAAAASDATYASDAATNAAFAATNFYKEQKKLNKQFLIQCINEYQNGTL